MYWTPWARLMKSITPNTSVRPAAIRNSSTPSWSPFRVWTMSSVVDIGRTQAGGRSINIAARGPRASPRWPRGLLHLAILDMRVGVILEYFLGDLGFEFAVRTLGDFDQIEV